MKYFIYSCILMLSLVTNVEAITADELMQLHKVTTTEMNAISAPQAGSLVYNTDDKTVFFYTGTTWKRLRSNGSETVINAGNNITVTGNGTNASVYVIGM